jgi:glycosyltransferase involved in cell wall biosynthesis
MISIIIPLYNQAKKLDECLASILKQTYENYEIIVVNDRSTDKLSWVMQKYKHLFGIKIEFMHNQENHGAPYTRNKGFRRSRGEFILFCDADAVLHREALEMMLETLKEHTEASYAYSNFKWGHKLFKLWPFDADKLKQMPYIHTIALMRREHFPRSGWDESLKKLQDWDLWLTMLDEGHVGIWIDLILFNIKPGGVYSEWVPSFFYKLFPFLPKVKKYNRAVEIVKKKHGVI